jgi:hypothetical protein
MSKVIINGTKAPNLPIPTIAYSQTVQESFSNALRLYFNTLDAFTISLSNTAGGASLSIPHISALDTTDQYATATNTPTIVKWNTLDSGLGFTLDPGFYAIAQYTGYYKIDYSLQYANTANAAHDVDVWLRVNNIDVPGSTSKITVPARKSAGVPSYVLMYSTVPFAVEAGDEIALWWATNQAYNTTGPVDGVYMEYQGAQTTPYPHPSVPSAIGAITFVSRI